MALGRSLIVLAAGLMLAPTAIDTAVLAQGAPPPKKVDEAPPEVWIFNGIMPLGKQKVSGTIVGSDDHTDFEMKLSSGVTCDSSKTEDGVGIVRLPSFACSDKRSLQAVFIPQGGPNLNIVGDLDGMAFSFQAHWLEDPRDDDASIGRQPILPPVPAPN